MTIKFNKNSETIKPGFNNLWPTVILREEMDTVVSVNLCNELMSITDIHANNNYISEIALPEINLFDLDSDIIKDFKNDVVEPAFKKYITEIFSADLKKDFSSYELRSWMSKCAKGYGVSLHNHSGSHLTGTFYLMAEEVDSGGRIEFLDPRTNANRGYPNNLRNHFTEAVHLPKTGDILIFPSFLYHHVHTYYSNSRFCLSVDLTLHIKHD
jgi:uncharacterized protein (TIGR02466 family)